MPIGNLDFTHSGAIGGLLAGRAFKQAEEANALEIANAQQDLNDKKLAALAQADLTAAIKASEPAVRNAKNPAEALEAVAAGIITEAPSAAAELYSKASTVRKNTTEAAVKELEGSIESANVAALLLENITDGPSLVRIAERAGVQGLDEKGVLRDMAAYYKQNGWTRELEQGILDGRQSLVSKKDAAAIELDRLRGETEKAQAQHYRAQTDVLVPAQADAYKALAEQRRKEGGGKILESTAGDRVLARTILSSEYEMSDPMDKPALDQFAVSVAERATELRRDIPSLTREESVRKAFYEMRKNNAFFGYEKKERPLGTVRNPAPLPIKEEGGIDAEALEKDKVYGGVGQLWGVPVRWTGREFVPINLGGK